MTISTLLFAGSKV